MEKTEEEKIWYAKDLLGCMSVHDEERSGRPSIITDDLVQKDNEKLRDNRRFTIL